MSDKVGQQLAVPPPPLRSTVPGVSPAVERVVMTALEKDPNKRFGSVREFALALEAAYQADILISEQAGAPVVPRVDEKSQQATLSPLRQITAPAVSEPTLPPAPFPAPIAQAGFTGTFVCSYRGHLTSVRSLSWSPSVIVSASGDETVHVWDTITNLKLFTFQHTAPVRVMAWSPDGKYIASGGDDATIQVWVAP